MTAVLERGVSSAPEVIDRPFRLDVQGLRAVAVTLVVLYHCHVPGIDAGYVGVDVFFVISGFLITGQILREVDRTGRVHLLPFYARRMRRLLPAALLVVAATVVVARFWGPLLQVRSTAQDALWTAVYAINVRLAAEGVNYQQADGPQSPLQHFWSLAVEEQFYLFWPLVVLLVAAVVARRFRRRALGVVVVLGTVASLYASAVITQQSAPTAYFSVQTRAWEFGFGALVALSVGALGRIPARLRAPATWAGLALVVGSALVYDDATPFPGTAALVPVAGCALVIAGGCGPVPRHGVEAVLRRGPIQFIGRLSYSWYLWHWPVLILAPSVLGVELSWIRNVELSVLALWVAGLTYAMVERATQRGRVTTTPWLLRGFALSGVAVLMSVLVMGNSPSVAGGGHYAEALDLSNPSSARLSTALQLASTNRDVPGNLNPALLKAAKDVPITQSSCHLDFLEVEEGPCVYGDPSGAKTVVLVGDSHAQQWDGALNVAAKNLHWRLISWTKAACPVSDVQIDNDQLKREFHECDQWRDEIVARISALHPALVLASQSDSVPGRMVTNQKWADETAATVRKLTQPGTRVVFIADTPYPKADIPTCVAAHLSDVRACSVPRAAAYHDTALLTQRHDLVTTTLRSANITVVDPVDWLCSASTCPVIVGNTLVYRDNSHMTNTYSALLGPILQPLLASTP